MGARDEDKIRVNADRTMVSTKTKANTEALDTAKARSEAKAKSMTHMAKASIK